MSDAVVLTRARCALTMFFRNVFPSFPVVLAGFSAIPQALFVCTKRAVILSPIDYRLKILAVVFSMVVGFSPFQVAHAAEGREIALRGNGTGVHACASCHGEAGEGIPANGYPRLTGMSTEYLTHQLDSFADGKRSRSVMTSIAGGLTPAERRAVASYYSAQTAAKVSDPQTIDDKIVSRGKDIALRGIWSDGLPGCSQCHGPRGEGIGGSFPPLAGQNFRYLTAQLHHWKNGERSSDPNGLMTGIANKLEDADIAAIAAYYASLPVGDKGAGVGR